MAELREQELKKAIEAGTLSGAYLLYGEEKYSLLQCVRKVEAKAAAAGFADFNLHRFDAADTSVEAVAEALEALPCFAAQNFVLLRDLRVDALPAADVERYQELIRELPDTTVFFIYLPTLSLGRRLPPKWKAFCAANPKKLTAVQFSRRSRGELERYLVTFAEKRGCALSKDLAKRMVTLCGDDLQTLHHEIGKLCGYAGGGTITRAQMDATVTVNAEAQVFALSGAIIGGQYADAYRMVDSLLGQGEEPVAIVALLASAYLNLYRAKTMLQSGRPVAELADAFDYKGKEFLLRTAEQDSSRFSMAVLRRSLDLLLEADLALKGGSGSSRDEMKRVVLDTLIAKLLLASQEKK